MKQKIAIVVLTLILGNFEMQATTARDEYQQPITISASIMQPFETAALNILSSGKKYIVASIIINCPAGSDNNSIRFLNNSGYIQLGEIPALMSSDTITITLTPDNESSDMVLSISIDRNGRRLHNSQERVLTSTFIDGHCVISSTNPCIKINGESVHQTIEGKNGEKGRAIIWVLAIILADILIVIYLIRRRKEEHKIKEQSDLLSKAIPKLNIEQKQTNKIICFGEFHIYNGDAVDIAQRMSPILKELLILFICNEKEGLTSEKIRTLLWNEKTDKEARNSRNVYITKLRQFLAPLKMDILYEQGKWTLSSVEVEIDLWTMTGICEEGIEGNNIEKILEIISRGELFQYINYDWLYKYKERLDDVILLRLTGFISSLSVKDDPQMVIRIADAMFIFDSLNELALTAKCKSLKELAKHTVARQIYWLYCKEYKELYGEEYSVSFSSIMTDE